MYIHTRDWDAAEYVAQNHCQEGLIQVLVAKASEAAEAQDFATAESLLLRAHKPEIIINHYKVLDHSCICRLLFKSTPYFRICIRYRQLIMGQRARV